MRSVQIVVSKLRVFGGESKAMSERWRDWRRKWRVANSGRVGRRGRADSELPMRVMALLGGRRTEASPSAVGASVLPFDELRAIRKRRWSGESVPCLKSKER
jgi:hypothetical protein